MGTGTKWEGKHGEGDACIYLFWAKDCPACKKLHSLICTEYDAGVVIPILQIRKLRFRENKPFSQGRALLTRLACSGYMFPPRPYPWPLLLTWLSPGPAILSSLLLPSFKICGLSFIPCITSSVLISRPLDSSQVRSHACIKTLSLKVAPGLATHTPPPPGGGGSLLPCPPSSKSAAL